MIILVYLTIPALGIDGQSSGLRWQATPNPSGKVIFYGPWKSKLVRNLAEREIQDEEVKTSAQESKKKANVQRRRSSSIGIASTIALFNDQPRTTSIAPQTTPLRLSILPTQTFHDCPPSPIMRPDCPRNLRYHTGASARILLRVLKDACDLCPTLRLLLA